MTINGKMLAGIFMAIGGAVITIDAILESNVVMILSGICICFAGIL